MKKLTKYGGFQGDVTIIPVDVFPEDAKPTQNRIVAFGEATGHNHQIVGEVDMRETAIAYYFMVAPDDSAVMQHIGDEHETIEITPGQVWMVPKYSQREYDGENERRAMD